MQLDFLLKIQELSNTYLDSFFMLVTNLGYELVYTILIAIIFWCISKHHGLRLMVAVIVTSLVNTSIKEYFKIARPIYSDGIKALYTETAPGYSFPSGHTQAATSFWFYSSMMIRKKWFSLMAILVVFLVGISRLYLRVHWPTDIIGGILIGIIVVFMIEFISRKFTKRNYSIFTVLACTVLLPVLLVIICQYDETAMKMAAVLAGGLFGYFIELKYIDFDENTSIKNQLMKIIIGIFGVIIIKIILKKVLPDLIYSDIIRYLVMGIWITFLAPWMFVKFRLSNKKI